jgi:hypothetical protein
MQRFLHANAIWPLLPNHPHNPTHPLAPSSLAPVFNILITHIEAHQAQIQDAVGPKRNYLGWPSFPGPLTPGQADHRTQQQDLPPRNIH